MARKILNLTAYNRFLFSVSWIAGFIIGSDDRLWSDHSYTFINSFKVHPMLITLLHIKAIIRRNIMTVVQEIIIQKFAVRELPTETLFILEKFWLSFFFYLFKGILKWFHTWQLTLLKNNWLELSEKLTRVKQKLIFYDCETSSGVLRISWIINWPQAVKAFVRSKEEKPKLPLFSTFSKSLNWFPLCLIWSEIRRSFGRGSPSDLF